MFGINPNHNADSIGAPPALLTNADVRRIQSEMKRLETDNRLALQALAATKNEVTTLRKLLSEARSIPNRATSDKEESVRLSESLEIIKKLKIQIADLNHALIQAKRLEHDAANWERLREEMVEGLDANSELAPLDRLNAQRAIEATNQLLEQKNQEIRELQSQLDVLNSISDMIYGLPNDAVDSNACIQEERERLARIQSEWRTKTRETEMELSIERANISRRMADVAEKQREVEQQLRAIEKMSQNSKGRNWLTALGLADEEE